MNLRPGTPLPAQHREEIHRLLRNVACALWDGSQGATPLRRELSLLLLEDPDARLRCSHAEALLQLRCNTLGLPPGQMLVQQALRPAGLESSGGSGGGSAAELAERAFVVLPGTDPSATDLSSCILCLNAVQLLQAAISTGCLSKEDAALAATVLQARSSQTTPKPAPALPATELQSLQIAWDMHEQDADARLALACAYVLLKQRHQARSSGAVSPAASMPLQDLIWQLQRMASADLALAAHRVLMVGGMGGPLPEQGPRGQLARTPSLGNKAIQAMVPSLVDWLQQHPRARGFFRIVSAGPNVADSNGSCDSNGAATNTLVTLVPEKLRSRPADDAATGSNPLSALAAAWDMAAAAHQPAAVPNADSHGHAMALALLDTGALPQFLFDYEGGHAVPGGMPASNRPAFPPATIAMSVPPSATQGPSPGSARNLSNMLDLGPAGMVPTLYPTSPSMAFMELQTAKSEIPQEVASCWDGATGGNANGPGPGTTLSNVSAFTRSSNGSIAGGFMHGQNLPDLPGAYSTGDRIRGSSSGQRMGGMGGGPGQPTPLGTFGTAPGSLGSLSQGLQRGSGIQWSDPNVWLSGSPEMSHMRPFDTGGGDGMPASTAASSYSSASMLANGLPVGSLGGAAGSNAGGPGGPRTVAGSAPHPRVNTMPATPPSSWAVQRGAGPFAGPQGMAPILGSSLGSSSGMHAVRRDLLHRDSTESCSQHPSPSSASDAGGEERAQNGPQAVSSMGENMDLEAALEAIINFESTGAAVQEGPGMSVAQVQQAQQTLAHHVAAAVRAAATMQGPPGNGQGSAGGSNRAHHVSQGAQAAKSFAAAAAARATGSGSYPGGGNGDMMSPGGFASMMRPQTAAAAAAAAAAANGRSMGGWAAVAAREPGKTHGPGSLELLGPHPDGSAPGSTGSLPLSAPAAVAAAAARSAAVAAQQQQQLMPNGMAGTPPGLLNGSLMAGMPGLAGAGGLNNLPGLHQGPRMESRAFMRLSPRLRAEIQQLLLRVPGLKLEDFDDGVVYQLAAKKSEEEAVGALRTLADNELTGIQHLAAYINHVIKHYHVTPGGEGTITTPSAAVRASSMPMSSKAMLQKLPLRVYKRLEEVVARCAYMEWKHFDAGVIKVMGQLSEIGEEDVFEELDLLENTDLSSVEYMPAYLNKRLNNRLWSRRKQQQSGGPA